MKKQEKALRINEEAVEYYNEGNSLYDFGR